MQLMTLATLAAKIGAEYRGADLPLTQVSIDSRAIAKGGLFVAIRGPQHDAHSFVEQAVQAGAGAVMVDHPMPVTVPQMIVADTTKALGRLAKAWRLQFQLPIIALTGSCGKTGTKEMIAAILRRCGHTLATPGNKNNFYGLPLTLLELRPEHQFAVIEMGTNSIGEIGYLADITQPTVALITNIQASHIGNFGSFEALSNEKSDIFKGLVANGIAIINQDEPFARSWEKKIDVRHRVSFALHSKADVTATQVTLGGDHVSFTLHSPLGQGAVRVPLIGAHVVYNALAAAAATLAVGANLQQVIQGLADAEAVKGRFKPHTLPHGVVLIDDTYNASASSVHNAIRTLAQHPGKKIFVMSNMMELGSFAEQCHREMGEWARDAHLDALLLAGDASLLQPTLQAFPQAQYFGSKAELLSALTPQLVPGSMVVVKGSRSNKMEEIVAGLLASTVKE